MKRVLFIIAQVIWGFPQTLVGFVIFLLHLRAPHSMFHGAVLTRWPRAGSVSLGLFIFVSDRVVKPDQRQRLCRHEYGHCIQSLIFGPFYLIVMGLPSFVWAMLPAAKRWRQRKAYNYYRFFTERFADYLADMVLHP